MPIRRCSEIARRRPSLVYLDIWMQGSRLDGLQLLDVFQSQHPDMPVVMISGHGNVETAVSAIRRGAYDYIEKPFKIDRLLLDHPAGDGGQRGSRTRSPSSSSAQAIRLIEMVGISLVDAAGARADREIGADQFAHLHLRRFRHGQGALRPPAAPAQPARQWRLSSRSTARSTLPTKCRSCCSGGRPETRPARCAPKSGRWSAPMAARSICRKWPHCRRPPRQVCCGRSSRASSRVSAAQTPVADRCARHRLELAERRALDRARAVPLRPVPPPVDRAAAIAPAQIAARGRAAACRHVHRPGVPHA